MGEAAAKPSPEPTQKALRELGATRSFLIGDTVDDILSAVSAGKAPALPLWRTALAGFYSPFSILVFFFLSWRMMPFSNHLSRSSCFSKSIFYSVPVITAYVAACACEEGFR